jgi:squalene synthase HpnC
MSVSTVAQLELNGPDRCETLSVEQARAWCRRLVGGRYENFSVLSRLVPEGLRDDFAAVYSFCRWADDLGDEIGNPTRSLELLGWWRRELDQCFAGQPRHPVFMALEPTIRRHELPIKPFDDLIRAFEQDQTITRYETWDQLLGYCRLSADPVGRLVLMMCGERREDSLFRHSDQICTALQLTNHWQDVCRDVLDRDRIYLPRDLVNIERFEERLVASAKQGYGVDRAFLGETRPLIRQCVERTWTMYAEGAKLFDLVTPATRPLVWLLAAGGQTKLMLVAKAWWMSRNGNGGGVSA